LSILIAAGAVLSVSSIFTPTEAATRTTVISSDPLAIAQPPTNTGLQSQRSAAPMPMVFALRARPRNQAEEAHSAANRQRQ
jgi:hypothetical protein